MSTRVRTDMAGAVRFATYMAALRVLTLTLGFQGASGAETHPLTNVPVATIALYNEFGTIDAPARSFLRSTMFERRTDIAQLFATEVRADIERAVASSADPVETLSRIGHGCAEMVRERIKTSPSWATANAPSTIAKKGHAHPLIGGDPARGHITPTMYQAVSWAVRRGDAIVAEGT